MLVDKKKHKKISYTPFLFGLERIFLKKLEIFYDTSNLYIHEKGILTNYPLKSITSIKNTHNKVFNKTLWEIEINCDNTYKSFRFLNNWSAWNSNFYDFIELMKRKYPKTVKSKFNIFTI